MVESVGASKRNWICPCSSLGSGTTLAAEKSTSEYLGPRRMFLPALPYVYWAGETNAAGLNHSAAVLFEGYSGTPGTTLGYCEFACELELLLFIATLKTFPDW